MDSIIQQIATELNKRPDHVENVVRLLDEGNTIPFIARYRKELHGAMDDTSLRTLEERLHYLRGLAERKEAVKSAIEEQGKLTDELKEKITKAETQVVVDDLYPPYRPKRRTRATIAKEKGLDGIEAIYSLHSDKDESYVRSLADKFNLKISGGSDYHGTNKPDIFIGKGKGNLKIPYSVLEQLLNQ